MIEFLLIFFFGLTVAYAMGGWTFIIDDHPKATTYIAAFIIISWSVIIGFGIFNEH